MSRNSEQILIIHSVNGTSEEDLHATKKAIRDFSSAANKDVKVEPRVFQIPHGAAPGATLSTELSEQLTASIGAVVFVDDLRPNVVYEMGFFHGQGRTVLLLTRQSIDSIWTTISDLAGAAVASLDKDIETVITLYLKRLYDDISHVKMQSSFPLPSKDTNYLNRLEPADEQDARFTDGACGKSVTIDTWGPNDFNVGINLFAGAKFVLMLRADVASADYTVYFRVRYSNRHGGRGTIWLGLSSVYRVAGLTYAERTFPAQAATTKWRILQAEFDDLLRKGFVLGSCSVDYIEKVRFRAGSKRQQKSHPIEFGYMSFGLSGSAA